MDESVDASGPAGADTTPLLHYCSQCSHFSRKTHSSDYLFKQWITSKRERETTTPSVVSSGYWCG